MVPMKAERAPKVNDYPFLISLVGLLRAKFKTVEKEHKVSDDK